MERSDSRAGNEMRKIKITKNYISHPRGSVLMQMGQTKVICTASVEEKVPHFMRGTNRGWVTAEYSMLPGATHTRTIREAARGKLSGRTQEIQRLVGRAIRAVTDLPALGERTVWLDCDVIQADGGTRCASITGAFVAFCLALKSLKKEKIIDTFPIKDFVAAVSVGVVNEKKLLDLDYSEDSTASVDLNVVKTASGKFVEIQGTAEAHPFDDKQLSGMLVLADQGIKELIIAQKKVIGPL